MIKSLKEARNAQIHYLKSGDIDEAAAMSELLSVMLAQEILNAFGGIGTTDMCVIVAACELASSFVLDAAEDAGLTDEMVQGAADDLVNNANAHTERITVMWPTGKEADSDD